MASATVGRGSSDKSAQDGRAAAAVANRLRLLQADLADRSADERQAHLADELQRTVARLPQDDRETFLDQVLGHFPAWGEVVAAKSDGVDAGTWNDPLKVAGQLVKLVGRDPGRRRDVAAVLAPVCGVPPSLDRAVRDLQRRLGLPERAAVDAGRVAEVATILIEFARKLEQFVNGVWATVGKNAGGPSPRPLGESVARLAALADVTPSTPLSTTQLGAARADLEAGLTALDRRTRVLIATLRAFARQHAETFAPADIESLVNAGFLGNRTKACWEKYIELCGGTDRDQLEGEIAGTYATIIGRLYPEMR